MLLIIHFVQADKNVHYASIGKNLGRKIRNRREIVSGSCTFPHDVLGDRDYHHLKVLIQLHVISMIRMMRRSKINGLKNDSGFRRSSPSVHCFRWLRSAYVAEMTIAVWDSQPGARTAARILFTMAESTIDGSDGNDDDRRMLGVRVPDQ